MNKIEKVFVLCMGVEAYAAYSECGVEFADDGSLGPAS